MAPDELERALEAATPAPWLPYSRREGLRDAIIRAHGRTLFTGEDDGEHPDLNTGIDADVLLVAALRNAAPALLADLRAERTLREEMLGALREASGWLDQPCSCDCARLFAFLAMRKRIDTLLARSAPQPEGHNARSAGGE